MQHKKRHRYGGESVPRNGSQVPQVPGADQSNCDLSGVNLAHADLHGAHLSNADLTNAKLRWSDLTNVSWTNCGCPSGPKADPTCCGHLSGAIPAAGCKTPLAMRCLAG